MMQHSCVDKKSGTLVIVEHWCAKQYTCGLKYVPPALATLSNLNSSWTRYIASNIAMSVRGLSGAGVLLVPQFRDVPFSPTSASL